MNDSIWLYSSTDCREADEDGDWNAYTADGRWLMGSSYDDLKKILPDIAEVIVSPDGTAFRRARKEITAVPFHEPEISASEFHDTLDRILYREGPCSGVLHPRCPEHSLETWQNADQSRRCTHEGCKWTWALPKIGVVHFPNTTRYVYEPPPLPRVTYKGVGDEPLSPEPEPDILDVTRDIARSG